MNVDGGQSHQLGQGVGGKIEAPTLIAPQRLKTELLHSQAKAQQGKEENPVAGPDF
jgi:hypothetical protein